MGTSFLANKKGLVSGVEKEGPRRYEYHLAQPPPHTLISCLN